MSGFPRYGRLLFDPITGAHVGFVDRNGNEQLGVSAATSNTSGTPGNASTTSSRGRAAFAAAAQTCTITNPTVTVNSSVFVQVGGADGTLTTARVTAAAGSFTVTGNAAATAATPFDWFIQN